MAPQTIPRADLPMKVEGVGWAADKIFGLGHVRAANRTKYRG